MVYIQTYNTELQQEAGSKSMMNYHGLMAGRPHFNNNWCTINKPQPTFGNLHNILEHTVTL